MPVEMAADALEEIEPEVQRTIITRRGRQGADLLEEMPPNEAASLLRDLNEGDALKSSTRWKAKPPTKCGNATHDEASAGSGDAHTCIEASPSDTAGLILERIRAAAEDTEILDQVFVLDEAPATSWRVTLASCSCRRRRRPSKAS